MTELELIKSFINNEVTAEFFFKALRENKNLEKILSEEIILPKYMNDYGSIYLYLLTLNWHSIGDRLDAIGALRYFLDQKNIEYTYSKDTEKLFTLLLKVQPSWLNIDDNYLKEIISQIDAQDDRDLEKKLKIFIEENFKFLKKPKWLQDCFWPIENNQPLFFVKQIDISEILHDNAQLYIFYNKKTGEFKTIKQSA